MLVVALVAAALCPQQQRRSMLVSSALTAPIGMHAFLYVPEYWDPVQVGRWLAGPEDILFGLANGATVWVLAAWVTRGQLQARTDLATAARRYAAIVVGGLAMYAVLAALGVRPMDTTLVGVAVIALLLIRGRPEFGKVAVRCGVGFAICYALLMLVSATLWPHFAEQWTHANLWGLTIAGVPLEEHAWSLAFGSTWPLVVAYVLEARVVPVTADSL